MEKIDQILEDLFAIEPELKSRSSEIRQIVTLMLKERPQVDLSPDFFLELRGRLADKISEQPRFMVKKFVWPTLALAGVFSLLLLVVWQEQELITEDRLLSRVTITELSDSYFGKISSGKQEEMLINNAGNIAAARGVSINTTPPGGISNKLAVDQRMMIPENPIRYKMIYQGEEIKLTDNQGAVYRKNNQSQSGKELAKQIQKLNLGFIDLKKFTEVKLDNFSFKEDRPDGYVFSVNLENNSFSIYQNWEKWPQADDAVKKKDLPDRETIIKVAKDFVQQYKINLSSYGQPQLAEASKLAIADYQAGRNDYSPESATVVFPLIVNKEFIYSNGGGIDGLTVEVDLGRHSVSSASGNFSLNLEKSNYELETDGQKIKEALARSVEFGYELPEAKEVEVILGSPKNILARIYNYDNKTNQSYELFVPALMFPVINQVDGYYQKQIIIPLVKDLVDNQVNVMMR